MNGRPMRSDYSDLSSANVTWSLRRRISGCIASWRCAEMIGECQIVDSFSTLAILAYRLLGTGPRQRGDERQ